MRYRPSLPYMIAQHQENTAKEKHSTHRIADLAGIRNCEYFYSINSCVIVNISKNVILPYNTHSITNLKI